MEKHKIRVCGEANQALITMKGKTGLTPNILARIGFCLSLKNQTIPKKNEYNYTENVREFNRHTLFGDNNFIYMALLRQWLEKNDNKAPKTDLNDLTEAHINRGILLLKKSVSSGLLDVVNVM